MSAGGVCHYCGKSTCQCPSVVSPPAGVGDAQCRHLADEVRRLTQELKARDRHLGDLLRSLDLSTIEARRLQAVVRECREGLEKVDNWRSLQIAPLVFRCREVLGE